MISKGFISLLCFSLPSLPSPSPLILKAAFTKEFWNCPQCQMAKLAQIIFSLSRPFIKHHILKQTWHIPRNITIYLVANQRCLLSTIKQVLIWNSGQDDIRRLQFHTSVFSLPNKLDFLLLTVVDKKHRLASKHWF